MKSDLLEAMAMPASTDSEKEEKIARVKDIYVSLGIGEDAKAEIVRLHTRAMYSVEQLSLGKVRYEMLHRYADNLLGRTK